MSLILERLEDSGTGEDYWWSILLEMGEEEWDEELWNRGLRKRAMAGL